MLDPIQKRLKEMEGSNPLNKYSLGSMVRLSVRAFSNEITQVPQKPNIYGCIEDLADNEIIKGKYEFDEGINVDDCRNSVNRIVDVINQCMQYKCNTGKMIELGHLASKYHNMMIRKTFEHLYT